MVKRWIDVIKWIRLFLKVGRYLGTLYLCAYLMKLKGWHQGSRFGEDVMGATSLTQFPVGPWGNGGGWDLAYQKNLFLLLLLFVGPDNGLILSASHNF